MVAQEVPFRSRGNAGECLTRNDISTFSLDPGDGLFIDFDGTLTELGPDPDAIALDPRAEADLLRLAARLDGAVAILSGRDIRDLAKRVPRGLWRAGGHGLEIIAPGEDPPGAPDPPPDSILKILRAATRHPGIRLELKGPVAALHFRAAPDAQADCLAAAQSAAASVPGHVHQAGKMVVEVKPSSAHKGLTLEKLAAQPPFKVRRPVMFGDDTTDEDAIRAALALGGTAVKVGEGESAAPFHAGSPEALRGWLAREAARLC